MYIFYAFCHTIHVTKNRRRNFPPDNEPRKRQDVRKLWTTSTITPTILRIARTARIRTTTRTTTRIRTTARTRTRTRARTAAKIRTTITKAELLLQVNDNRAATVIGALFVSLFTYNQKNSILIRVL